MHLQIKNISKLYSSVFAVNNVSLDIDRKEFVCILGPSGCGKTTLLRLVAGLEKADQGELFIDNENMTSVPAQDRGFGIVFQSYSLFQNMNVAKNIGYGLSVRKVPQIEIDQRVKKLLALVHLSDQNEKFPHQLSGGQQQRVAIARALAVKPKLLLLDEPLSALDAKVRKALRVEIREVQKNLGIPTMMVTHDQEEAMTMADKIVCMKDGVIEQVGTPSELYNQPATLFVATFLGSMNVLDDMNSKVDLKLTLNFDIEKDHSIGIRPEEIKIIKDAKQYKNNAFSAVVTKVENLGSISQIQTDISGQKIVLEQHGFSNFSIGDELKLHIPSEKIISFFQSY